MVLKKRATRATKHINPLPVNGFMRSTSFFCLLHCLLQKRWMCCWAMDLCVARNVLRFFLLLDFQMLITSIITFSMYVISRTIQNISFNALYDLTTHIKSLICKITRFYMKIFTMRSYGTLNDISMISCIATSNCMVYNKAYKPQKKGTYKT